MKADTLTEVIMLLGMASGQLHKYTDNDMNDLVSAGIDLLLGSAKLSALQLSIQEMIHQATKTAYEMHGWAVTEGLVTKDSIARGMEMNDYATDLYASIKDLQEAIGGEPWIM